MLRTFTLLWLAILIILASLLFLRLATLGEHTARRTTTPPPSQILSPQPSADPLASVLPSATTTATLAHSTFQTGVVFPQWGPHAYSNEDANWVSALSDISVQTAARWLSLPITFHQANEFTTTVEVQKDLPSPDTLASGIQMAHAAGYHVFIYPLLTLDGVHSWSGYIQFSSLAQASAWFDSYWQALEPYVVACEKVKAEQFSLGNEFERLEGSYPDLWRQLLAHAHQLYHGRLVYSINWSSLQYPLPEWFDDPNLSQIGVSTYFPLTDTLQSLDPASLPQLWHEHISTQLDALAQKIKKPIFISEIGYRNTHYAGYLPYMADTGANESRDDNQQAALYNAALKNVSDDPQITGIFIWAWKLAPFSPDGKAATGVLHYWFQLL